MLRMCFNCGGLDHIGMDGLCAHCKTEVRPPAIPSQSFDSWMAERAAMYEEGQACG